MLPTGEKATCSKIPCNYIPIKENLDNSISNLFLKIKSPLKAPNFKVLENRLAGDVHEGKDVYNISIAAKNGHTAQAAIDLAERVRAYK